jgi:hypothetical protein
MKSTFVLTAIERKLLREVALHIGGDIESMGDKSEPPDQRARAKQLEGGRAVIFELLRITTPNEVSTPK